NQIVSGNIVRKLTATLQLAVYTSSSFFINAEISFVNRTYIIAHRFQIFLVRSIENNNVVVEYIQVFLLEYLPIFTQDFVAICIVLTILGNLVNEEKRKGLDSHIKQLFFLLEVRKDSFTNLNPTHIRLLHISIFFPIFDHFTIVKVHCATERINVINGISHNMFPHQ